MTPELRQVLADAYGEVVVEASLHTYDPMDGDDSDPDWPYEVVGTDHVSLAWTPGDLGSIVSEPATFTDIPPDTEVQVVGLWDASGNLVDVLYNYVVLSGTYTIQLTYIQPDREY